MRILIVEELYFQNKFAVKIDADLGSFSDMSFILLTLKIIFCWFVNDVRQIKSKNLTVIKESLDVIGRRLPVKRTHREIVVFSAVNS